MSGQSSWVRWHVVVTTVAVVACCLPLRGRGGGTFNQTVRRRDSSQARLMAIEEGGREEESFGHGILYYSIQGVYSIEYGNVLVWFSGFFIHNLNVVQGVLTAR